MNLIDTIIWITQKGYHIEFEESLLYPFVTSIVILEKSEIKLIKNDYLISNDLMKSAGEDGLALVLINMIRVIEKKIG